MAISNNIIGQYEANNGVLSGSATTDRLATDKDTFLKLLVAQLSNQDPLNPVEDKEFIAQLAQFTTVEELQNINAGVKDLNTAYLEQQSVSAASLINKMVVAGGDNITLINAAELTEADYPVIYFTLPADSAGGTFNVYKTNADGSIGSMVYSATMPGYTAGRNAAYWDGRDFNGDPLDNGTYIVNITAKDAEGNDMLVSTSSGGIVVGVEMSADGNHILYLSDGRTVNYKQIDLIMDYVVGNSGTGSEDGSDETGTEGTNTDGTGTEETGTGTEGTDTGGTGTGETGSADAGSGDTGSGNGEGTGA
ncbi:MAG: hypothetical protein LBQ51_09920 [Desulfovibrio sp.]|jgi:flagellar basal-body rod modification protein FlgD|nr:hypothetical protein [Desulfovibrio sp.]